jgi:hypothetical protein
MYMCARKSIVRFITPTAEKGVQFRYVLLRYAQQQINSNAAVS